MNFYKRHIGDYLKATSHLSLLEHGIYTRLLDVYYTREGAIPADQAARLVGARSKDEREALDAVLAEFFTNENGAWSQKRCDEEIATYQEKAERNREVGKRGGRPRTIAEPTNNPDGFQKQTQDEPTDNPSHKPVTNNQEPESKEKHSVAKATGGKPPADPADIIFSYGTNLLVNAGSTEKNARSFLGKLRSHYDDEDIVNTLRDCLKAKPLQPLEWLAAALPPPAMKNKSGMTKVGQQAAAAAQAWLETQ